MSWEKIDKPKMTTIELTDEDAVAFIEFRKHQQQKDLIPLEHPNWKHLKKVASDMQFGRLNLVIKDKIPVRIEKPMEEIILGIIRTK